MSESTEPKFLVGTSGWSYDDWVGPFYPEKAARGFSRLGFYADFFDCVEVNSTFYRHFPPEVGEKWLNEVEGNPNFVFIIKLFRDFTHGKKGEGADFNFNRKTVLLFLAPFAESRKLGGVLIQFSEFFRDSRASRDKVSLLLDNFHDFQLFLEMRHASWYRRDGREFLDRNNVSLVAVDQPGLSGMAEFDAGIVGSTAYVRLHGRNLDKWSASRRDLSKKLRNGNRGDQDSGDRNARYDYLYSNGELDEIEREVSKVQERCKRVYVVANNHPMGKAVANALDLIKRLRNQERVRLPDTVIKYFPDLAKIAERVETGSGDDLFQ